MSESRIPAVFIGHGSPMNALEDNRYTTAWSELAEITAAPASDRVRLGALVHQRVCRHRDERAAHDPRLLRLPATAVRHALPRTGLA